MKIKYYTDGSCRKNGSSSARGAYGYAIVIDDEYVAAWANPEQNTTNQRCEMLAILSACKDIDLHYGEFDDIEIISDSAYCINCIHQKWYSKWLTNGWKTSKKEDVANQDLWEKMIPYFERANITFTKTKGHADDEYNNLIDRLVQNMSEA